MSTEAEEKLAEDWYDRKTEMMEALLGKEHDLVRHAVIPYVVGGGLDLYFFPNGIAGTAIATKELSDLPGEGSSNAAFRSYELVMFTKHELATDLNDSATPFGRALDNINAILNVIAPYSAEAELNPNETCEFPEDMESLGGKCLIFDGYGRQAKGAVQDFGLLAVIEVFRSEMDFARQNGGANLIARLEEAGHYPYSDLEREPVV
jgi:hypothetical protein